MKAITISRQYGSGGRRIARQVCDLLGYRFFDKAVINQVATEVGLSKHAIVDFSEQSFRQKHFMDRFMQVVFGAHTRSISAPQQSWGGLDAHLDEDWCVQLVNRAITTAYEAGDVVIVGRGAQIILQDKPDVLHIRIQAPMEIRMQRIQHAEGVNEIQALQIADAHDLASSRYLDQFFKMSWDDPLLYHLVINTGKLPIEQTASLIVEAARQFDLTAV